MKTKPAARSRFDAAGWVLKASPPVRPSRHPRFTPLVPLLLLLAAFNVSTATAQAEDYTYTTNNGTITITGYTGSGGAVTIPSTINGLPVTSIGEGWPGVFRNNTSLTSVTIPDSVTSIGEAAFASCTSLTNVTIPNSVTSIGDGAFSGCTNLTSITIPDSVTSIEAGVFSGCTSLTSITIPDSVTSIGLGAFSGCTSLTNFTIGNSVTSIERQAFSGCTRLTSVTIPNNVTSIGVWAFYSCSSLTSITIPNSVTSIGDGAFSGCTNLTSVHFKGNAPSGYGVFDGDNNATVYYLPRTTGWGTTFGGRPTAFWTPSGGSVLLVSLGSTNPVPPYARWETAATNIQDAVDVAKPGDMVLVTNGVYSTGEKYGSRVAITNSIHLESFNGPMVTRIDGGGSVRCVYLGTNAVLSGFTLTNGGALDGAGVYCETSGVVSNCALTANSASFGGGAYGCTLYNCMVTGNSGGGAYGCMIYNCTVTGNAGGGVIASQPYPSTVVNSIVYGNPDGNYSADTILNYCLTTPLPTNGVGNIAADPRFVNSAAGNYHLRPDSPCIDAGTNLLSLINTDLDGEFRPWDGNRDGVAAFDIGAYEFRPLRTTLYVSLQSPNPTSPYTAWATAAHVIQDAVDLAKAGDKVRVTNGVYAVGSRGEYWKASRVVVTNSILLESFNGPLVTRIDGGGSVLCVYLGTNAVLSGFTLTNGWTSWYGGGVYCEASGVVTNCTLTGNKAGNVSLTSGSDGGGGGAYGGNLYKCVLTGNSAAAGGGGAYGSTLYDCTLTGNETWWDGVGGADGCTLYNCTVTGNLYGVSGCTLYNCTVAGNLGDGASGCTLYNCMVTGNDWGGASDSTLYNCTVTGNSGYGARGTLYNCTVTGNSGAGARASTLYGCTVTGNDGGGVLTYYTPWGIAYPSTVFNSIVYYNSGGNYDTNTTLSYCCTTPLPTNGFGNITGPPLFMDFGSGDYRLWENSPCIDAGTNLLGLTIVPVGWWVPSDFLPYIEPTDILGNTRFIDGDFDGTVAWDIGAYEFNSYKPPRFSHPPRLTVSGWQLNITGAHNKWVRVQRSSDLQNWTDFSGWLWMGSEGMKQITDGDMGQRMMFYRVVVD